MNNLKKIFYSWSLSLVFGGIIYSFALIGQYLSNKFGFLYWVSFDQLEVWYPNHHWVVFLFIYLAPFLFLLFLFYFFKKIKKKLNVMNFFELSHQMRVENWFSNQILVFVVFLVLTLFIHQLYRPNFLFQLYLTRFFLLTVCLQVCFLMYLNRLNFQKRLLIFILKKELPYSISILRIFFFIYLLYFYFNSYYSHYERILLSEKVALPFIGWLIDFIPVNTSIYLYVIILGVFSCIFIIFGYKTRFFLILNGFICFYIIASPNFFGKLWHNQIFIWISWIFMFSKCYDVFSIDSYLNKTKISKSANYSFPIRIIWLHFGLIYFWAGFYKLWDSGFDWTLSKSMVNQVQLEWLEAFDAVPWFRIDTFPLLLYIGGLLVILFEMSYFILLFNRTWRYFAVLGGLILHQLIAYFMYISFSSLQILYVFYIDFNRFYKKRSVGVKSSSSFSKSVLYFCMVIFSFNFLAGMFNVNSYPFSSYPSYSEIVPDKIKLLKFKCQEYDFDVHEIGKKNHFKWEDYGRIERQIIADFEKGEDVVNRLEDYWEVWKTYNPELKKCTFVDVYIQERPVSPEGKEKLKTIAYICKLHIQP